MTVITITDPMVKCCVCLRGATLAALQEAPPLRASACDEHAGDVLTTATKV